MNIATATKQIQLASRRDPYGSHCPFCQSLVPVGASVCARCRAVKSTRSEIGGGELFSRFIIWLHVFPTVIFLFGALAVAPWEGYLGKDLSLGIGKQYDCVQSLAGPRRASYEVIYLADTRCEDVPDLKAASAKALSEHRKRYPKNTLRPTEPAFDQERYGTSELTRAAHWTVSCAISFFALLFGFKTLGALSRLWKRIFGSIADPLWIRR